MIVRVVYEYKVSVSIVSFNNNIWVMRKFILLFFLIYIGYFVIKIGFIILFKFMFLRLIINCKNIMY